MCLEKKCEAKSRYIEGVKEVGRGGSHEGHEIKDLNEIKSNIQNLIQFWNANTTDAMDADMDN